MQARRTMVLFSGGMDSLIHLFWAQSHPSREYLCRTLFVDFGHRYAKIELEAARELSKDRKVPLTELAFPLGQFEQDDSFIPLRNLFLLQLASLYDEDIVFGMLYHEGPPDKRPAFVHKMQKMLREQYAATPYFYESRKHTIFTPFGNLTKTEMLHWYLTHGGPVDLILKTVGCYSRQGRCGNCISCFNRWIALVNNGLALRETYELNPARWGLENFLLGRKKRQSFFNPTALLYKWKYVQEINRAYSTYLSESPLKLAIGWKSGGQEGRSKVLNLLNVAEEHQRKAILAREAATMEV